MNIRNVQSPSLSVLNKIQTSSLPSEFEKMHLPNGTYGRCQYYRFEQTAENFCEEVGHNFSPSEVNQGHLYEVY
jgi:hypothetical protein